VKIFIVTNLTILKLSERLSALLAPSPGVTPHGIVAAVIAVLGQFFEDPDQRQLLASSLGRIPCQQSVEFCYPSSQLRPWLDDTLVLEWVSPDLSTFRTVFRDTFRSRAISLIVLPLTRCLRRSLPSTAQSPHVPESSIIWSSLQPDFTAALP
jgi:hypothetical protein